jgi:hypothetical protein
MLLNRVFISLDHASSTLAKFGVPFFSAEESRYPAAGQRRRLFPAQCRAHRRDERRASRFRISFIRSIGRWTLTALVVKCHSRLQHLRIAVLARRLANIHLLIRHRCWSGTEVCSSRFAVMMSTHGWRAGGILLPPRIVYSFAETGDAPEFLARIHSGFHTPALALFVYAALTWMLAVTGTILWVAAIAAAPSLILCSGVCASLIRFRRLNPKRDAFRVPSGPVLIVVAICISLALISALEVRQVLLMSLTALFATANWLWAKCHAAHQRRASVLISATGASE